MMLERSKESKKLFSLKEAGDSAEELRSNLGKTGYVITIAKDPRRGYPD